MAYCVPQYTSLATVKRGIYNPSLPSLRRMKMDDEVGKLPELHSRNTTTLTKEDFQRVEGQGGGKIIPPRLHSYPITDTGHRLKEHIKELEETRELFRAYLAKKAGKKDLEIANKKLVDNITNEKKAHFDGYLLTNEDPPPRETRMLFKGREHRDRYGIPAPLPDDIITRHRPPISRWGKGRTRIGLGLPHTRTALPW